MSDKDHKQLTTQVQIRLTTRQQKYRIGAEDAVLLMVPTHLRRFNLSEIVNHLLNNEKKVPFDFIIAGKFLRSSLSEYLEKHSISTENTIEIEYVLSSMPPKQTSSMDNEDWIAAIAGPALTTSIATACYDGNVRLWSQTGACIAVLKKHERSVKSIAWLSGNSKSSKLISGGEDQTVFAWEYDSSKKTTRVAFECIGHKGSVDGLSVNETKTHFASASFDSIVKIWTSSTNDDTVHSQQHEQSELASKRKRLADSEVLLKDCIQNLEAHVGPVTSVAFSKVAGEVNTLFSGGADHSVRIWNIETGKNLHSMSCEKVVLAIDHSANSNLIVTGHTDNYVRLWDPRDQNGLVVKMKLVSHKSWVPAVSCSPTSPFALATGSYDSSIKVWDVRSTTPLHTLSAAEDGKKKVLALVWEDGCLFSGGEEGKLRVHDMQVETE
ncbi:WD repeat-containing protein 12 [Physocladia obscura]|uniref:Ribosome biogenesis protein YTM1 n=1 Tax=Physocladia obscura TaxID=109957 RepID=A0AAD5SPX6_9FUNG|nr:WD repeat-containing protein 12 [Physocladia obscura]